MAFKDGYVKGFAEAVKGANAGDTKTVDVILLKAAAQPELADKTIKAEIKVNEVKTTRPPEPTHELMHEFGAHSIDQLRERIRVALERRLEYQQRQAARQQVLSHIHAAASSVQVWIMPTNEEIIVARQAKELLQRG